MVYYHDLSIHTTYMYIPITTIAIIILLWPIACFIGELFGFWDTNE